MQLPGQRRLEELVAASSQNEVAAKLNVKQQAISRWIRGSTIPNAFYQQALEKAFGIRREEWLTAVQVLALRALERDVERTKGVGAKDVKKALSAKESATSSRTPPASTRTPTKRARTSSPSSSSAAPSMSPPKRRTSSPATSSSPTARSARPPTDLPSRVLALLATKGEKMTLGDLADELDCDERIELFRVLHALKESGQVVEIPATGNTRTRWELAGSAGARARLVKPRNLRARVPPAPAPAPSSPSKGTPEERTLPLFGEPHNPIRATP